MSSNTNNETNNLLCEELFDKIFNIHEYDTIDNEVLDAEIYELLMTPCDKCFDTGYLNYSSTKRVNCPQCFISLLDNCKVCKSSGFVGDVLCEECTCPECGIGRNVCDCYVDKQCPIRSCIN